MITIAVVANVSMRDGCGEVDDNTPMLVFYEIFIIDPGANLCIIASSSEWTLRSE